MLLVVSLATQRDGWVRVNVACLTIHHLLQAADCGGLELITRILRGFAPLSDLDAASPPIDASPEHDDTALMRASRRGHIEVAAALIRAGATVDAQKRRSGITALFLSCMHGHDAVASLLLGAQANVNLQRSNGASPLYIACSKGHLPTVQHLIHARADVDLAVANGAVPLQTACVEGHAGIMRELISGAPPTPRPPAFRHPD